MSGRVIRGYWDCPQCGTKGIDGLVDECPNCGAGKSKDVRYYMKAVEEVSEEDLEKAGISKDENDGKHTEWLCAYCGYLNNYGDQTCVRCGADREEKESDYTGDTNKIQYRREKDGTLHAAQDTAGSVSSASPSSDSAQPSEEQAAFAAAASSAESSRQGKASPFRFVFLAVIACILAFLLWPHTEAEAITGFQWNRIVTVEEMQTFSESGWSLPYGARLTGQRRELYGYQQVIDHYETVYETRYRQVLDHYDTHYEYTDNGNGTFSEHEVQEPVYTTETYQVPVQSPVYRNEPVYQTKYYYEIDRWISIASYDTSGEDHEPYWSSEYTLAGNQRDEQRAEAYYTIYNGNDRQRIPYEKWVNQEIGDGIYVTRCRLGIEYSRKEQN